MLEKIVIRLFVRFYNRIIFKTINFISGGERIWRVISENHIDKDTGDLTPSFFRDERGISCDLSSYTWKWKSKRGSNKLPWPKGCGLAEFYVKDLRTYGENGVCGEITHDPKRRNKEKGRRANYAHSLVDPSINNVTPLKANKVTFKKTLTRTQQKNLIKKTRIVIQPTF